MPAPSDPLLEALEHGEAHRFSDFPALTALPRSGAAIYTIWDDSGSLIYVGVSGRSTESRTGPWGRLRSHWNGRRSGDQFCVYVADHYVLPALTPDQVAAIAASDPTVFVDELVAQTVRAQFSFRIACAPDYAAALATENAIKGGALAAGQPRLNPPRARRRTTAT